MGILIGFLTVILVLNCLLLILLVLIQLPKKEAGAGIAFGGGATDALFGAGSGNALTKITKYSAGIFIGLSLFLAVLNTGRAARSGRSIEEQLQKLQAASGQRVSTNAANPLAASGLRPLLSTNSPSATNGSAATNSPAPANAPAASSVPPAAK